MPDYSFPSSERLKSEKVISLLFKSGNAFLAHPVRVVWCFKELRTLANGELLVEPPVQVAFSVPKRAFKKAHDRNLLKRRMREAYRLQRLPLLEIAATTQRPIAIMFMFIGKTEMPYTEFEKGMKKAIRQLLSLIST